MDAPAYATARSQRRQRWARVPRVRKPADLPRWILATARAVIGSVVPRAAHAATPHKESARKPPSPAEFEQQLLQLTQRGVRILLVYSGVLGERYNAKHQLFEAFPALSGLVDVAYFADANHVFTELDQRSALMDTIIGWVRGSVEAH
jgi:hypothetical protein